jgi:hypothetical protein
MREGTIVILVAMVVGCYLIDNFQYDGYYRQLFWTQSNAKVQVFQDELRAWWRAR